MIRVTLALAMAADGIISWQVIKRDGLDQEGNPVLRWAVARWHSAGMIAVKLIAFVISLVVYSKYRDVALIGNFTVNDAIIAETIIYTSAAALGYARLLKW